MDLNAVTTIEVDGLQVDVRMQWGQLRALVKQINKADEDNAEAIFDAMGDALKQNVADVRGLTRDGEAVPWSPALIDELPLELVKNLWAALLNIGEQRQVGDPLAVSSAT